MSAKDLQTRAEAWLKARMRRLTPVSYTHLPVRDMVILKRDDGLWLHVLYGQTGGCVVHHTTNDILHIGCFGLFVHDDRPQRIGTEVILQAPVRWDGE